MRVLLKEIQDNLSNIAKCAKNKSIQITFEAQKLCFSMVTSTISVFTMMNAPCDDEPFDIMVDAFLFKNIIDRLKNRQYVNIVKNNNALLISTDPGEDYAMMRLPVITSNGKPDSKVGEEYVSKINVENFRNYTESCLHAAASSSLHDARMESFYIEDAGDNKLRVTALDGHRVAIRDSLEGATPTMSIMVSALNMNNVASIIDGNIKIAIPKSGRFVRITGKNIVIVMPAVDGSYYNVDQLLNRPATNPIVVEVDKSRMLEAIELATLINKRVILDINGGKITISSSDVAGETTYDVPVKGNKEATLKIGFNAMFLKNALESIKSTKVNITFTGEINPCIITSSYVVKNGDKKVLVSEKEVVLPVRIKA